MSDADAWPLRCFANPELPAAAFCPACRQPHSGKFLGVREDGRAICHGCARRDEIPLTGADANARPDPVLSAGWLRATGAIITAPHVSLVPDAAGKLWQPLVYGFVATVAGYAMTLGWSVALYPQRFLAEAATQAEALGLSGEASALAWSAGLVIPFISALRMLLGALTLHVGLAIVSRDAPWRASARVMALSSVSLVFCAIPVVGTYLAMVVWISTVMAWLRARHQLRTLPALLVVLPCVFLLTALGPTPFAPG